jgi:GAF domain-containing protein
MSHPVAEERPVEHGDALNLIRTIVAEAPGPEAAAQRVVEALHDRFAHYDWIGIYWVDRVADELVLGPWIGPEATEHTRIPIGVGICGAAAASGQTEIVADVDADPRYLACFTTTRSEIVVPIFADGQVIGEIDIDGSDTGAYDETDARFLEEVAALLAPLRQHPDSVGGRA